MAGQSVTYRCMTVEDIPQVHLVERKCFPNPWSKNIFFSELTRNDAAIYLVARVGERVVAMRNVDHSGRGTYYQHWG